MDIRWPKSGSRSLCKCKQPLFCVTLCLLFVLLMCQTSHDGITPSPAENDHSAARITVVTAYYDIPSKRARRTYLAWIKNFFSNIPCHLYIFTSKKNLRLLKAFRQPYLDRTRIIVKELEELEMYKLMGDWTKIKSRDIEAGHSPLLYLIWNQKWLFVNDSIQENAFQSEYFIWCDAGAFRSHRHIHLLRNFPDVTKTVSVLRDHNRLTLLLLNAFDGLELSDGTQSKFFIHGHNHIGGGFAAGHTNAWNHWIKNYYEMQRQFIRRKQNAGKDQHVMNAVAVQYPQFVNLISPKSYFNHTGDPWFYLQYFFSGS